MKEATGGGRSEGRGLSCRSYSVFVGLRRVFAEDPLDWILHLILGYISSTGNGSVPGRRQTTYLLVLRLLESPQSFLT